MFFTDYVHEVYFGKTPSLLAIEKQIGVVRNSVKNSSRVHMNSDPELLKLNDMIAKEFGFGLFSLTVVDQPIMNICTLPIDYRFDVDRTGKSLIADKKGFKFNPKYDYTCIVIIYTGIFLNDSFTDGEILAGILHEIGHNFYSCLSRRNGVLSALNTAMYTVNIILNGLLREDTTGTIFKLIANTNAYTKFDTSLERKLREDDNALMAIFDYVDLLKSMVKTGVRTMFGIMNMLSLGTLGLISSVNSMINRFKNPLNYIVMPLRYSDERAADNFPTMYGYGGEFSSFVTKFNRYDSNPSELYREYNKIPVIGLLYNTVTLPAEIMSSVLEEHPTGVARTQDQINLLKKELNSADLDPRMKKAIQSDLVVCEAELNKMIDISGGFSDPQIAKHLYNRILYSITHSRTLKEILLDDRKKFDRYDRTYFDKLEKDKI